MDYELRIVPASLSVEVGTTTSFDLYFTNNTEKTVTYVAALVKSNQPLAPYNASEENGVIFGEAIGTTDIIGAELTCGLTINDPAIGNYFEIQVSKIEGGSDIVVPNGKVATITYDLAENTGTPLNLTFSVEIEGELYYGAAEFSNGDFAEFTENSNDCLITDAQPITVQTVQPDPIALITQDIRNAYNVIASRGGTMPTYKNLENLADAISSIPTGENL